MLYRNMNGSIICPTCREPLKVLLGRDQTQYVEGHRSATGTMFCSTFCEENTYLTPRSAVLQ